MSDKKTELKKIKDIVSMMVDKDLVEVEIVNGDDKIYLRRPEAQQVQAVPMAQAPMAVAAPVAAAPAPAPAAEPAADPNLKEIVSPIVGTFYTAPSPDSPAYVKVGDTVDDDAVVCIVEAMKVMNEIKAELSGTIVEICVENGQAIEFGQALFKVKA